jgi:hypothetical protein
VIRAKRDPPWNALELFDTEKRVANRTIPSQNREEPRVFSPVGANRFMRWAKLRTSCCLSLAKLTAVVESVEGDFSVLADLDEVAVGITHVAAPFPAVIVLTNGSLRKSAPLSPNCL